MTITHDVLDLIVQDPAPGRPQQLPPSPHTAELGPPSSGPKTPSEHQTWTPPVPGPTSDIWLSSLETCSDLFIWGPSGATSGGDY